MKKHNDGVYKWLETFFNNRGEFHNRFSNARNPDGLIIACADSSIGPDTGSRSSAGELYIMKMSDMDSSRDATGDKYVNLPGIELALLTSAITDIIICGYSNFGTILNFEDQTEFKVSNAPGAWEDKETLSKIRENTYFQNGPNRLKQRLAVQKDIIARLKHILSCQTVEMAVLEGALALHGWHFDILTEKIYEYNSFTNSFEEICFV